MLYIWHSNRSKIKVMLQYQRKLFVTKRAIELIVPRGGGVLVLLGPLHFGVGGSGVARSFTFWSCGGEWCCYVLYILELWGGVVLLCPLHLVLCYSRENVLHNKYMHQLWKSCILHCSSYDRYWSFFKCRSKVMIKVTWSTMLDTIQRFLQTGGRKDTKDK